MRQAGKNFAQGRLPHSAPLANPYVPFQVEDSPKYNPGKGLVRGTLFPGLDLPFMGKVNQKELPATPMAELQALAFAVQELALYLDTHREDKEAYSLYKQYQQAHDKCKRQWASRNGPLNHEMVSDSTSYTWLNDPWPWEYCANKEDYHVPVR